jgi:long-subunit fatty acid transport protein
MRLFSNSIAALAALVVGFALGAAGQVLEISVSPTPVGSGARAAGMANAFVAIADDATAASWNPAGLIQLERPELSIVGAWNLVDDAFDASLHPEVASYHDIRAEELNYLSFVYPVPFAVAGRPVTLALSYQRKYEFGRKFAFDYSPLASVAGGTILSQWLRVDYEQEGGLSTITPAVAFGLTNRLSVGASFNFWRTTPFDENQWEQETRIRGLSLFGPVAALSSFYERELYEDVEGLNFTLGALWNVTQRWTLGLRYDTDFSADAEYSRRTRSLRATWLDALLPTAFADPQGAREKRSLHFPDALALGAAWRPNDRFTISMDVTRIDWNDFYVKDNRGVRRSLVDGAIPGRTRRGDLDPTYSVRLGAEYVLLPKQPDLELRSLWTLRGGLFVEQEPATGIDTRWTRDRGDGKPDTFWGFSAGMGCQLFQRINIDAAYQMRRGDGVNSDFIQGIRGFETDTVQHRVLLSTILYF